MLFLDNQANKCIIDLLCILEKSSIYPACGGVKTIFNVFRSKSNMIIHSNSIMKENKK